MHSVIEIESIKKHYVDFDLCVENFKIQFGQKVGIIGNNGAGKTTLLSGILDLIDFEGKIKILNFDNRSESWKKHVSSFIDRTFLIDFLTPNEYYFYNYSCYHNEVDELPLINDRFGDFASSIGENKRKLIRQLSKGNISKVGIIGCLVPDVDVYILDEPFANLDVKSRIKLIEIINNQFREKTFLVSSHDLSYLHEICDSFIIMNNGLIMDQIPKLSMSKAELEKYLI